MPDCLVATFDGMPDLDPDDRVLAAALRARGVSVAPGVWDDPTVDWGSARLCLIRSTWDYPRNYARFCAWLDATALVTTVRNDPAVVRWNSDKGYLRDLAAAGTPVVPTAWVLRGEPLQLDGLLYERGWADAIVKPARGAAGLDVMRVAHGATAAAQAHLERLVRDQDVLVQPYLHAVASHPERSLIYIDGAFSHAIVKQPFDTKLQIEGAAPLVTPTAAEFTAAECAMAAVPGAPPLYARVDIFGTSDAGVVVNELELIEPALYLGVFPAAAQALSHAIVRDL